MSLFSSYECKEDFLFRVLDIPVYLSTLDGIGVDVDRRRFRPKMGHIHFVDQRIEDYVLR